MALRSAQLLAGGLARRRGLCPHVLTQKSVSALWRSRRQRTADQVLAAHEARSPQRSASSTSTRRSPVVDHKRCLAGRHRWLIAASFVHRTSRAADPPAAHPSPRREQGPRGGRQVALARRARAVRDAEGRSMLYKAALPLRAVDTPRRRMDASRRKRCRRSRGRPAVLIEQWCRHAPRAKGGWGTS